MGFRSGVVRCKMLTQAMFSFSKLAPSLLDKTTWQLKRSLFKLRCRKLETAKG